ncbi:MAG: hypothetical protein IAF38_10490, partial [Bacteroidia bacterium]|nr:hypothetical protein [Bacteroidia bacterium]
IGFPLYWALKSKNVDNKVLFPIVYSFNNPERSSLTIFPLFSYGHTTDSSKSHLAVTPLFWHVKNENEVSNVLFPVFWNHTEYLKNDTIRKNLLLPFYWSYKTKNVDNKILFPLVYSFRDTNRISLTAIPFFSYGHNADFSKSHLVVTPLFWHVKNENAVSNVLFPLFWNQTQYAINDTIRKNVLFPLYWATKSKNVDNKVLFPLVYSFKNKERSSFTFFPLFSYGHKTDSSMNYFAASPLFWHVKTKESVNNVLFPIFWNQKQFLKDDTIRKTVAFPLYWAVKSKEVDNKILFPLVYSLKNKERSSFTFFPLFSYGHKTDSSMNYFAASPLFWHVKTKESVNNVLFPVFWNQKQFLKDDTIRKTVAFPLYWATKSKDVDNKIIFPLVYSLKNKERSSFTFFPLFSYGHKTDSSKNYLAVTPLFWHVKTKESVSNVLFPLFWNQKQFLKDDTITKTVAFPLYWATRSKDKNNTVLFPFAYNFNNEKRHSLTVLPIFSYGKSKDSTKSHLVVTPLFWHLKSKEGITNYLFPLYWNHTEFLKDDTTHKTIAFPFYWASKTKEHDNKVVLPFVYSFKNKHYNSLTVFPLVSTGHSPNGDTSHLMITPLAGFFHKPEKSSAYFFPVFNYKKEKDETHFSAFLFAFRHTSRPNYSKTSFIWPICENLVDSTHHSFRIAPIVWSNKTDTSNMFSIQPFFYTYKSPSRKTFILNWILYKRDEKTGVSVANSVLWRAYYKKKYENGDHETRVMHLLYANIQEKGKTEKSILPIFHSVKDTVGNKSLSVCFGIYSHSKEYKAEIKDFYEEERILWFIRLRSNYKQLKAEGKGDFFRKKSKTV